METIVGGSVPEDFRSGLVGRAYLPKEEGYEDTSRAWVLNARQNPALVISAQTAADIAAGVRLARQWGVGVGIMATGHGVGNLCDGGVLINTSLMRGASVDPETRTARVEAGAMWSDVMPLAAEHGLAGLLGSSSGVGVVGFTMGGGFGWLGRRHGFNSHTVRSAEVVTADGELVTASADENPDLFWGIKGGAGNFGIVASMEFELLPLTTVYGGNVFYPMEASAEALELYSGWTTTLPEEMTTGAVLLNIPPLPFIPQPLQGKSVIALRGCYCGDDPREGEELFRPLRTLGEPIMDTLGEMPYMAWDSISMDPTDPMPVLTRSGMLSDLTPQTIEALVESCGANSGSPLLMMELRQLGGALTRTTGQPHPMAHTEAGYLFLGLGAAFTPEMGQAVDSHLDTVEDALGPHAASEGYVNFIDLEQSDRISSAYSTEDWKKLRALKKDWDPHNVFRFNRNIPPAAT